jgi:hypothetical protein
MCVKVSTPIYVKMSTLICVKTSTPILRKSVYFDLRKNVHPILRKSDAKRKNHAPQVVPPKSEVRYEKAGTLSTQNYIISS